MFKRFCLLTLLVALLPLSGCKKSEGTKIENFFGAPPSVSEVSLTKERKDFECSNPVDLCTCCCLYWVINDVKASIDLVTASAKVVDATEPTAENPTDILVVVVRFLDPPPGVLPGASINRFSLQMFDTGLEAVGELGAPLYMSVYSGDLVAGDGTYTRKFYFGTQTDETAGNCIQETDNANLQYTYSTFSTSLPVAPSETVEYEFVVQAIDRAGNIATSTEFPLPIQGTFRESLYGIQVACGDLINPSNPSLGCYPPPGV